jgi:SprT-like family protein
MPPVDLSRLFDTYNRQYWRGRLPKYRVIRRATLPHRLGSCSNVTRTILIHRQSPDDEALTLLHEMAHIGPTRGFNHGPIFQRKLRRLVRLGAPPALLDDVERFDGTELRNLLAKAAAAGRPLREMSLRDAVLSDLEGWAEEDYRHRWPTIRRVLAAQYQASPAQFDRVAPWAEIEWQRLRREAYREARHPKEFEAIIATGHMSINLKERP